MAGSRSSTGHCKLMTVGSLLLKRWFNTCRSFSWAHGVVLWAPRSSSTNSGLLRTCSKSWS